jgi:Glycosyltransferase
MMHVLCIVRTLPLPGSGDRKEGVYPVMLRAHVRAGFRTALAVQAADPQDDLTRFCKDQNMQLVCKRRCAAITLLQYLLVRCTWGWASFVWRNRTLLAGIDRYVADHGRPDLVVGLQACASAGRVAYLVGRRHSIPFASRENTTWFTRDLVVGRLRSTLRDVVGAASKVLTLSPQLADNMERALGMAIPHKVTMPNPVANEMFEPPETSEWVDQFARSRFIFAGWTNWRDIKRVDIAIDAFAMVHAEFPDTCLIVAGPVPSHLQQAIEARGLGGAVLLAGSLNRVGIRQLAHRSDCCIVPSDHDPGNNSVLEAMAAGTPAVVTRCGGAECRITAPWLGRISEPGDAELFSAAMRDMFVHRESFERERIADECRRLYSEGAFARRLLAIYGAVEQDSDSSPGVAA